MRERRPGRVTASGVQDFLRLAGRAGGVHHVQRVLCVERLRRVFGRRAVDYLAPPHVHAVVAGNVLPGAPDDETFSTVLVFSA